MVEVTETIMANVLVPSLIILYAFFVIAIPVVGLIFKDKNTKWGKFWGIWITISILGLVVTLFLIYCPTFINDITNKFISLFN